MKEYIGAAELTQMILSAAAAIENNRQILNEMNVFPVPDGDTGVNMSLTLKSAVTALAKYDTECAGKIAELAASSLLRGARGNSGVILSLLFRGFARSCVGRERIDADEFAKALAAGVDSAYRAVMKPAEGTILSVSRRAAAKANELAETVTDISELLDGAIEEANIALEETVELNPVLKKAGVVDAGGKGWVIILGAMKDAIDGNPVQATEAEQVDTTEAASFAAQNGVIVFAYCTEFIVNLSRAGKKRDITRLRALLESIGDCVVVVDDDDIIKVHAHTNNPDKAIGEALKYGELVSIKIENMREQHTQKVIDEGGREVAAPEKKYGFVAVCAGEGIVGVYKDLGVDVVVEGGQTMNPSTQDILAAIDSSPSDIVFVLPNNKNIIMAAQQAIELSEKNVVVLHTTSVPQGISAMLAFNPDAEEDENTESMQSAADGVSTGSITYAARDSEFDGHQIKEGEYLALCENRLSANGTDLNGVARQLISDMGLSEKSFVSVFYGEGVSEQDASVVDSLCRTTAPEAEVMLLNGGQPVYYYMISAE